MGTLAYGYQLLASAGLLGFALVVGALNFVHAEGLENRYRAETNKAFDEVVNDLKFAISEHNYRLTGENRIGEAIAEREKTSFPRASVIHFCNLTQAKEILDIAPDYLLHMPCRISVYEGSGHVFVEALLLPEDDQRVHAKATKINQMLRLIVDHAVE